MPVKRRTKACLISGIVLLLVAGCFWVSRRSRPNLKLIPNGQYRSGALASFTLTNGTTVPYDYWILIEFKSNHVWSISPSVQVMQREDRRQIGSKQAATFSIAPPQRSGKWRIAASCWRSQSAPPTFVTKIGDWLVSLNMVWVAERLEIYDHGLIVPGPEMGEEGQ